MSVEGGDFRVVDLWGREELVAALWRGEGVWKVVLGWGSRGVERWGGGWKEGNGKG